MAQEANNELDTRLIKQDWGIISSKNIPGHRTKVKNKLNGNTYCDVYQYTLCIIVFITLLVHKIFSSLVNQTFMNIYSIKLAGNPNYYQRSFPVPSKFYNKLDWFS